MSDFTELAIGGRLATPSEHDWDEARAAWNLVADQRPSAVAFVESAEDVAKVVRFAAEHELKVAGQGTGHGAVALGPLDDTVLIKTERMRGIEIDPDARTARVEAGVLVLELSQAAQAHGLSSLPGSSPDVGVTGFTLGGASAGWAGATASPATASARSSWSAPTARRGRSTPRTMPTSSGPSVAAAATTRSSPRFTSTWSRSPTSTPAPFSTPPRSAPRPCASTATGQRAWATTSVRFIRPPDVPDVPEPLRNRPLLTIDGACIGGQPEGEATIAPLRVPGLGHHKVIRELPDEAIETFAGLADPESSPLLLAELRQLGGALGRPDEDGGALTHLDAAFVMLGIGLPMTPELGQAIEGHLDRLHEAMRPWAADGGYFNFAERPCDADAILPPETCARLAEVKGRWDPDDRIMADHAVALDAAS